MTTPTASRANGTEARITSTLESIARSHFHKLADRARPFAESKNDEEDFLETAVWAIRAALEEAYTCGYADAEAHHGVAA